MTPKIAQKSPYAVTLESAKKYYWCACGKSNNQPFCDSSHNGTEFKPVAFQPEESSDFYLCGCKHTKNPPYCDGSHTKL
jgi:CDGSH-type Zn-finger protein